MTQQFPQLSRSEMHQMEVNAKMAELLAEILQSQRDLWQLVRKAGGEVVINQTETHPLWALKYEKLDAVTGSVRIRASQLPDPPEIQIIRMAARLAGTNTQPSIEAANLGFVDYPNKYLMDRLQPYLTHTPAGGWVMRGGN